MSRLPPAILCHLALISSFKIVMQTQHVTLFISSDEIPIEWRTGSRTCWGTWSCILFTSFRFETTSWTALESERQGSNLCPQITWAFGECDLVGWTAMERTANYLEDKSTGHSTFVVACWAVYLPVWSRCWRFLCCGCGFWEQRIARSNCQVSWWTSLHAALLDSS